MSYDLSEAVIEDLHHQIAGGRPPADTALRYWAGQAEIYLWSVCFVHTSTEGDTALVGPVTVVASDAQVLQADGTVGDVIVVLTPTRRRLGLPIGFGASIVPCTESNGPDAISLWQELVALLDL